MLQSRIDTARQAMNSAQDAANSEEKSSAGDKYETGRAMSQIERDNYAARLEELQNEMNLLQSIDAEKLYDVVNNGCVMSGGGNTFFIASGLGVVSLSDQKVAMISPRSPLAAIIRNKKAGESFLFNGREILIEEVF
jgi:transcription elongation GreA/GreB family factor